MQPLAEATVTLISVTPLNGFHVIICQLPAARRAVTQMREEKTEIKVDNISILLPFGFLNFIYYDI